MSGKYGGGERVIFSIIKALNRKYKFYYVCPQGDLETQLKEKNIEYYTFSSKKEMRDIIVKIKPDKIHAHDFKASFLASNLLKIKELKNIKIISHLHTDHKWAGQICIKSFVYIFSSFRFFKIIFVSNFLKENFKLKRLISKKSEIIINSLEEREIILKSKEFSIQGKYDLIFLGRLSEYKNPIKFIEIVNNLVKSGLELKCLMVGDGELKEKCVEKIESLSLKKVLEVIGYKENPFPYLKNSKILVIPSLNEAYGLVALEANVLSKPVLASKVGGLVEVVNKDGGKLCDRLEDFQIEIKKMLGDESYYIDACNKAKKNSEKFTNTDKFLSSIENIYRV